MGRVRAVGAVLAFALDLAATTCVLLGGDGDSSQGAVTVVLLAGRLLGLNLLSLLAVRLALGRWPWLHHQATGSQASGLQPGSSSARQAPLLAEEDQAGSVVPSQPDGDERSRQIDATVSAQQELLKMLARGVVWRNVLLMVCYVYVASCSIRIAVLVVRMDTSSSWNVICVLLQLFSLVMIQLEFVLLKGIITELTSGDPVNMSSIHEHPLYWADVDGKGYVQCSVCNEKLGEKTGGYVTLQCRLCSANRWGFGGFQMCMQCYRKNAVKCGASDNNASAGGILRGDRGPKIAVKLTVVQYVRRLSSLVRFRTLLAVLVCVCGSQSVTAYIPKAQGDCISALVKYSEEEFDKLVLTFAVLVLCNALMSAAMSIAIQTLQTRLMNDMSVRLFRALLCQDIAFYDNAMTGQMNSRLNNDLRQAVSPVSIIMNSFVANIVMLLVGFGICIQASWRLTVLAFTFLTPVVHISAEFSKWAGQLMATQYTYMADAQGTATQALTNIRTVRTFGARDMEIEKYDGHMRKSMDVGLRSAWGQGVANLLSTLVQQGASFLILYYGGHLALQHEFEVGSIITFTYLWNRLSSAFTQLNENLNQPVKSMSAGQRVFEILDLEPDIQEEIGSEFPEDSMQIGVQLKDVCFTYQSRADKKILNGVCLDIAAGKTTAVVGKSGCGKSTLSKLLLRFYDPQEGEVLLNTADLKDMHLAKYRNRIGVVSQDTQLFRVTVTENITYGLRPGSYSQEDVERAAKLANADEFIRSLPEGYKTMVGEGGHDLSGGQKQRLSIARALVRRPRLLLLDEATSALDAENEALVQEALDNMMKQMQGTCTIMVIAHRLSTIKDADKIIVLHEGLVVEEGTHEELVRKQDGRYATMIARQLQSANGDRADEEGMSEEQQAKQTQSEIMRLIDSLPESKRGEVLRSVMMAVKGKGKGH